jgi:hypothetical protein
MNLLLYLLLLYCIVSVYKYIKIHFIFHYIIEFNIIKRKKSCNCNKIKLWLQTTNKNNKIIFFVHNVNPFLFVVVIQKLYIYIFRMYKNIFTLCVYFSL